MLAGGPHFWLALQEVFDAGVEQQQQQRCWVHQAANVLDKLPESLQGRAKELLHDISWRPPSQTA